MAEEIEAINEELRDKFCFEQGSVGKVETFKKEQTDLYTVEEKEGKFFFKNKEVYMVVENNKLTDSNEDDGGFNKEMDGDTVNFDVVNYNDDVEFEEVGSFHNEADLRQEEAEDDEQEQGDEGKMV